MTFKQVVDRNQRLDVFIQQSDISTDSSESRFWAKNSLQLATARKPKHVKIADEHLLFVVSACSSFPKYLSPSGY